MKGHNEIERVSLIVSEATDWWASLTPKEQEEYLKTHPRSRKNRTLQFGKIAQPKQPEIPASKESDEEPARQRDPRFLRALKLLAGYKAMGESLEREARLLKKSGIGPLGAAQRLSRTKHYDADHIGAVLTKVYRLKSRKQAL